MSDGSRSGVYRALLSGWVNLLGFRNTTQNLIENVN